MERILEDATFFLCTKTNLHEGTALQKKFN